MTFPKTYQRKFSCVNYVSMMIDVSIATVYSEVYFDYFLSFFSFPLPILLCACFDVS